MGIEICTVGGYEEIGKNCTAIRVDDEVVICDMGVHLDKFIPLTEEADDVINIPPKVLMREGAIPDISKIRDWRDKVIAIMPTHAHLDHVAAIPFIANRFDAPIICTPYTAAVIRAILKDERMSIPNEIKELNVNATYKLSEKITIEFINMTHSTPHTVTIAIHTPYGIVMYANDFKFDSNPTLGKKPNFKRLRELGDSGKVVALMFDSTYSLLNAKCPSESVAKAMLKEVMLGTDSKGKVVLVTTFSSHLARLKSIIEFGKQMNRKIVFIGRSLAKYVKAGEDIGIINFTKDVRMVKFSRERKGVLRKIDSDRGKYLIVCTGHQGEPLAVLPRMVNGEYPFDFKPEDHVIFSSSVIPTQMNIDNREILENKIKRLGVRIFRDVHVSGHAAREDMRDMINLVRPKHVIPAHCELKMAEGVKELALEMGYDKKNIHISSDGNRIRL